MSARGMTLIEIMIVVTIMASLMGVVGVYVVGALDEANKKEAKIEIGKMKNMLGTYYATTSPHTYPDQLKDLKTEKNITQEIPTDPWGNEYVYRKKSRSKYVLFSKGPDGKAGTSDDVKPSDSEEQ
jgi:general secretion pathway protein G